MLYCASQAEGPYGETIAQFRPSLKMLAHVPPTRGGGRHTSVIPRDWRANRRLGVATLAPVLLFVDIEDANTVQELRPTLAHVAVALGIPDIDLSAITGPRRELTQELALQVYTHVGSDGAPLFAGIRYILWHHHSWECWAVFTDRIAQRVLRVMPMGSADPDLGGAARFFGLTVQGDSS